MPLGANVPRRRPAADASSLILPPRTFAPAFRLSPRPTSARQERRAEPAKRIPPDVQTLRDRPEFPCGGRSEEHTSELQYLMRISYAVCCLHKKILTNTKHTRTYKQQ